jgi:YHS domain-containing protein
MNKRPSLRPCLAMITSLLLTVPAVTQAQAPAKSNPAAYNLPANKLALQGYDPVAYFTLGKAVKGSAAHQVMHDGVTYHFSSDETLKAFQAEPVKYLPTYGGWCATAMAKGEKVEIDPANFKVTNGRLFLFFNAWYADAKKAWIKDEAAQEKLADANWRKLSGE